MSQGYKRQSSYRDGDPLLAQHTNAEFDQLELTFDENQGHTHSGAKGQGGLIPLISSADGLTKVVTTGTEVQYWVGGTLKMTITEDDVTFHDNILITGLVNGRDLAADAIKIDNLAIVSDDVAISASVLRTRYLSNSGTEEFTTEYKEKLEGIQTGATADLTATEVKTLVESNADTHTLTDAELAKLQLLIDEKLEEDPSFFD